MRVQGAIAKISCIGLSVIRTKAVGHMYQRPPLGWTDVKEHEPGVPARGDSPSLCPAI